MSSNKLKYDECQLNQSDIQRVDSMNYHLFQPKYSHHSFCSDGPNGTCSLSNEAKTSIENDLLQLNNRATKCSMKKYQPPCPDAGNCEISNNNFVPVRIYDRDISWTNIKKPETNGLQSSK